MDAHVGRAIFFNCIKGYLQDKTRILVTHQLQYLPHVDYIYILHDGKIENSGTFPDLIARGVNFASLVTHHASEPGAKSEESGDDESSNSSDRDDQPESHAKNNDASKKTEQNGKIIEEEERFVGSVEGKYYKEYLLAAGSKKYLAFLALCTVVDQLITVFSDVWLGIWATDDAPSSNSTSSWSGDPYYDFYDASHGASTSGSSSYSYSSSAEEEEKMTDYHLWIFALIAVVSCLITASKLCLLAHASWKASKTLHQRFVL